MTAVAQAKFSPPSLAGIIERPRLLSRMDEYAGVRLFMIIGPAAQGKSILAATWLLQSKVEFAWINVAETDETPGNFFRTLIKALKPHLSENDFFYLFELPAVAIGSDSDPGYGRFVSPLRKRLKKKIRIVVDDLDQLPENAAVFGLLQALVDSGPVEVHWLLLSRKMPPLAIEPLNVKRQVLMIDNRQLAFTAEETRSFFKEGLGRPMSEDQYCRIQASCEGWVGGMVLLNQALEGLDAEKRSQYLEHLPEPYISAQAGRYFDEVILEALSPETRDLVIQSAMFGELRPEVLGALFPEVDVEDIFESRLH